jgi:hypothetical protein
LNEVGKIVMSDGKAGNCKMMIVTHMAMLCSEGSALVPADAPKDAGALVFTLHRSQRGLGLDYATAPL